MMEVIKRSGEKEPFDELKVRRSLVRSGASKMVENRILRKLEKRLYSGITTAEIYRLVYRWLGQEEGALAAKYNLKQAIIDLGPSGHPFELFLSRLLETYQFQTRVSQVLSGKCVSHEVDIIAKAGKGNYLTWNQQPACYMVECKFHSRMGIKVTVKTALYVWGRFYDLKEAPVNCFGQNDRFSQGLLATNTKITSEALKYCRCMNLAVLSWDYPRGKSLSDLVAKSHKHPLTCLGSLPVSSKQQLLKMGLVFCQDLLDNDDWRQLVGGAKTKKILAEVQKIIA